MSAQHVDDEMSIDQEEGVSAKALVPEILIDESDAMLGDLLSEERAAIEDAPAPPEDNENNSESNESNALVLRQSHRLANDQGEWFRSREPSPPSKEVQELYRSFVSEATRYERLSDEEERALGYRVRDHRDRSAAKKLVVHNLRLAIKMAHQYRRQWANIMDLVQEASTGMTIAADKWDPDQGTRFGTYAVYWIRAQLTRFLMMNGRMIHTGNTRAGRKLYFKYPKIRRQLEAAGEAVNAKNVAEIIDEDEREVRLIMNRLEGREASLSASVGEGDTTLGDMIEADIGTPEELAGHHEMQEFISGLIVRFSETIENPRDRDVWTKHLISNDPLTLVELANQYGVSKQRMGQLATKLKRAFRRHVVDELGPDTQLSWLFSRD